MALFGFSAAAPGQTGTQSSSFGSGRVLQTDFTGSGYSGPNGENPVGTLTLSGFLNFTATVTCSNSSGNAVVSGYRIDTGERAGWGFLTSSIDNGRPRNGRPVDVSVYSGYLRRPPVNCPSPGDSPPHGFRSTGGGPFTRGDFTLVDGKEYLPPDTPSARIARMRLALRPTRLFGPPARVALSVTARVCGLPGIALLRFTQKSSPAGRNRPVDTTTKWRDELRHDADCVTHRVSRPLTGYAGGRRFQISLSVRTSGRRWSRPAVRRVDAR